MTWECCRELCLFLFRSERQSLFDRRLEEKGVDGTANVMGREPSMKTVEMEIANFCLCVHVQKL